MMDLFSGGPAVNILPCDGVVNYHGRVFDLRESQRFFTELFREIPWENDETIMFGKRIVTARKVAWFAEGGREYSYSGTRKLAHDWVPLLEELKGISENLTGETYNSCLLNLYHAGDEGMGWHSDHEKIISPDSSIASLSFGAERKFSFKHKQTKETVSLVLEDGSLLDMRGETQRYWLHQLPKTKKVPSARINLTFRKLVGF